MHNSNVLFITGEQYGSPQSYSWWRGQQHFINCIAYETSSLYKNAKVHNDYHRCLCFIFDDDDDDNDDIMVMMTMMLLLLLLLLLVMMMMAFVLMGITGSMVVMFMIMVLMVMFMIIVVIMMILVVVITITMVPLVLMMTRVGVNGGGDDEGNRITYLPQQLQYWTTMKHGVLSRLGETSLNTHLNVSSYPLSRVPDCQYPVEEHP